MDSNKENIFFSNTFGTVSDKRVILNSKNGAEDIPIKQISSVAFERKQNIFLALIYLIIGVVALVFVLNASHAGPTEIVLAIVFFLFCLITGIAYYMGHHQIKLSASGRNLKAIKVEMAKTKAGQEFFEAIRKQLISN